MAVDTTRIGRVLENSRNGVYIYLRIARNCDSGGDEGIKLLFSDVFNKKKIYKKISV